jgi:hypothetical protein
MRREARRGELRTLDVGRYHWVEESALAEYLARRPAYQAEAERVLKLLPQTGKTLARFKPIERYATSVQRRLKAEAKGETYVPQGGRGWRQRRDEALSRARIA